jgi:UDPglucose 6-dehydrogenase
MMDPAVRHPFGLSHGARDNVHVNLKFNKRGFMKITIIGTGYVGLVSGACFAEMGHDVICVDVDQEKIKGLKAGIMPIYEPGLEDLVKRNFAAGRLHFITSLQEQPFKPTLYFIAVGTPSDVDGSADLRYVLGVANDIGRTSNKYAIVIDKSTVPVGTADLVRKTISKELKKRKLKVPFDVVSNPEFLKEGDAIKDTLHPDRVVIGSDSAKAIAILRELYMPFTRNHERTLTMGIRDAEMTKYAANSMLAAKISFMNEIAGICEKVGVDVENVRLGIGSDSRIGFHFIYPGCGYGGACFPKDVKALLRVAEENHFDPLLLNAIEERNNDQKYVMGRKVVKALGENLKGKTLALWGLAFKPGTDDMREATSVVFLTEMIKRGAKVRAYDPAAMEVAKRELPKEWFTSGQFTLVARQEEAWEGADAFVLLTEWKQFRNPAWDEMKKRMKGHFVFDGRNQYNPSFVREQGFTYEGIGR